MSGPTEPGSTSSPSEDEKWHLSLFGWGTRKWKSYLTKELGFAWDPRNNCWVKGQMSQGTAEELASEIRYRCAQGRTSEPSFKIKIGRGGEYGDVGFGHIFNVPASETWEAVANRAREILTENKEKGVITRKEELGYLSAIAVFVDRKSRPIDKKAAVDLLLKMEGIFEDRRRQKEEGDEALGTRELIDRFLRAESDETT